MGDEGEERVKQAYLESYQRFLTPKRRFLMVSDLAGEDGVSPIHVVLNFMEELEAKVGRE